MSGGFWPVVFVFQDWKPGSRCRVAYSADSLIYPAEVVWVSEGRCQVRFDGYNNEEEHDLNDLLAPNELNGPSSTAAAKVRTRTCCLDSGVI